MWEVVEPAFQPRGRARVRRVCRERRHQVRASAVAQTESATRGPLVKRAYPLELLRRERLALSPDAGLGGESKSAGGAARDGAQALRRALRCGRNRTTCWFSGHSLPRPLRLRSNAPSLDAAGFAGSGILLVKR